MRDLFKKFGQVISVRLPTDLATGKGRGFGFVTMVTEAEAKSAMSELDGKSFNGRQLRLRPDK